MLLFGTFWCGSIVAISLDPSSAMIQSMSKHPATSPNKQNVTGFVTRLLIQTITDSGVRDCNRSGIRNFAGTRAGLCNQPGLRNIHYWYCYSNTIVKFDKRFRVVEQLQYKRGKNLIDGKYNSLQQDMVWIIVIFLSSWCPYYCDDYFIRYLGMRRSAHKLHSMRVLAGCVWLVVALLLYWS